MSVWQRAYARRAPWFLLPALLLLGLFVVWPLVRAFWWSLHAVELLAVDQQRWVGASQYSELLGDERFRRAFGNTALFALMVVPVQTLAALLLALWVNRPEPAWRWLRLAFFVPTVMAVPALSILWTMLYQPAQAGQIGLVNVVLRAVGIEPRAWLAEPALALPAIAVMSVWQGVGLQMMIFLAGLQSISREMLEAARLDGATALQRTLFITLPAMRNTLAFAVSVTTVLAFRLFVQPYLMTRGGPNDATLSVVQAIYETTFVAQDLGRASASAFLFLAAVGLVTALTRAVMKEERA